MDLLEKIANLRSAVNADTPRLNEAEAWWPLYESIEYEFDSDQRATSDERAAVHRLRDGVSKAILSVREERPNVDNSVANLALTALQRSIERRTVGADGLPLRT